MSLQEFRSEHPTLTDVIIGVACVLPVGLVMYIGPPGWYPGDLAVVVAVPTVAFGLSRVNRVTVAKAWMPLLGAAVVLMLLRFAPSEREPRALAGSTPPFAPYPYPAQPVADLLAPRPTQVDSPIQAVTLPANPFAEPAATTDTPALPPPPPAVGSGANPPSHGSALPAPPPLKPSSTGGVPDSSKAGSGSKGLELEQKQKAFEERVTSARKELEESNRKLIGRSQALSVQQSRVAEPRGHSFDP